MEQGWGVSVKRPGEGDGRFAGAGMQKPPEICLETWRNQQKSGGPKAGASPARDYNACTT